MRRYVLLFAMAFGLVGNGGACPARAAETSAAPASCTLWADAISITDRVYAVLLWTRDPTVTEVHVGLYSDTHDYYVNVDKLRFLPPASTPPSGGTRYLRAEPVFVSLPRPDDVLAATAEPVVQEAQSGLCRRSYRYTDSYRAQLHPAYQPTAAMLQARKPIFVAFNDNPPVLPAIVTIAKTDPKTCSVPYSDAVTTWKAEAGYPEMARLQGVTGTSVIRVDLDLTGKVQQTSVYRSSGNSALDAEANHAAANSRYAPETFRCEKIGGTYLFIVTFTRG